MTIKYKTVGLALTTSSQDVYTVPANFKATIDSVILSNKTSSYVNVTVQWYSAANTTNYSIFGSITMEPNTTIQLTEAFYLEAGDKIKASATLNNTVEITVASSEKYSVSIL